MSQTPAASVVQSTLLSKLNERQALRAIQTRGPLSRAEIARYSGISAPTASRAVESLLRVGLLEESDAPDPGRGRPARKLRLTDTSAQVIGLVLDADECRVVSAGLDGSLHEQGASAFPTPAAYDTLLSAALDHIEPLLTRRGVATLGLGISIPGLLDYREQRGILSPNLPLTNGRSPVRDLAVRLGIPCVMRQESHALCLAEKYYGSARGLDDFAMLDVSIGVGLGVMSGGQLLTGHRGLAGEIGHITVAPDGRQCGCGNCGCLETVASDSALAWELSQRAGRRLSIEEALARIQAHAPGADEAVAKVCRYLAVGIAAVINLFNPSTLFVHGRMFAADPTLFSRLLAETERRALPPAFADCRLVQARGSKRQGAIAGIIEHLLDSVVPSAPQERRLPAAQHTLA